MASIVINGVDINALKNSKELFDLLDQVDDFDLRKLIRARLKEVKDGEKEERNAYLNRIENQREMSIQNKFKQTIEQKQRYLNMYDQMAKQPESAKKLVSAKDKFKIMDQQANPTATTTKSFANSPTSIKDSLIKWCSFKTKGYPNVSITNFSSSFADGLAFCAIIHHYFPDSFDFNSLDQKNRRRNFEIAFKVAEDRADIAPLLDVNDMIMMGNKPDWKCVFCYIQSLYRTLRKLD